VQFETRYRIQALLGLQDAVFIGSFLQDFTSFVDCVTSFPGCALVMVLYVLALL